MKSYYDEVVRVQDLQREFPTTEDLQRGLEEKKAWVKTLEGVNSDAAKKEIEDTKKEIEIMEKLLVKSELTKQLDELQQEKAQLIEDLNEYQRDFYNDYDVTVGYLEDSITEFADGRVSIYYSDIEEYYKNHIQEASDALKEFGYNLSDFADLDEAIHKGSQIAEFLEIEAELYEGNRLEDLRDLLSEIAMVMGQLEELTK